MKLGSLFSGYGGLDIALASVLPVEHAWVCDNNPAAAKVLPQQAEAALRYLFCPSV